MQQIRYKTLLSGVVLFVLGISHVAQASCTLPYQLTNGQTADATQVMANFAALVNCQQNPGGATNAIQFNAGLGNFGGVGPLANGQLIVGSTGNAPQVTTLSPGPGVTITNGPGSIMISAGGGGGGGSSTNKNITIHAPTSTLFTITSHFGRGSSSTPLTVSDDVSNGFVVSDQTTDSTGWKTILRAIPGSPSSFAFSARVLMNVGQSNYQMFGLAFVDANGHMASWANNEGFGQPTLSNSWDDGTWHDANYSQPSGATTWLQLTFDASGNLHYFHSVDGTNWIEINQGTTLADLDMGVPVAYGFFTHYYGYANSNGLMTIPWFYSDEFPAPTSAPIP